MTAAEGPGWLDAAWTGRQLMEINPGNANPLTNYQVDLQLSSTSIDFASTQAAGQDLRFTLDDGITLVPYWLEKFDSAGKTAKVWLKIPSIPAMASTSIYVYYGNPAAVDGQSGRDTFELYESFDDSRASAEAWESNGGRAVIETSMLMSDDGQSCDMWYRAGVSPSGFGYAVATDTDCATWSRYPSNPINSVGSESFPYVIKDNGVYYMFFLKGDGNLYLSSSSDKVNWSPMKGGAPVYSHSSNPGDWDYMIFNPAVQIVGGTWHMLLEGQSGGAIFHVGYASSTLAELDWSAHRSANFVQDYVGNPYLTYVPSRNALLDFTGDISTGIWKIGCRYASLNDDLANPASWYTCANFSLEKSGIHLADPALLVTDGQKSHNIIFQYGYDQSEIYQAYSDLSLEGLYDAVTTGSEPFYFTPAPNNPIFSVNTRYDNNWTVNGNMTADGSGVLDMPAVSESDSHPTYETVYSGTNYIYEFDAFTTGGAFDRLQPVFAYIDKDNFVRFWTYGANSTYMQSKINGVFGDPVDMGPNNAVDAAYHAWKIVKAGRSVTLFIDGQQIGTAQQIDQLFYADAKIGLSGYNTVGKWKNVRIRKYVPTEAIVAPGSPESLQAAAGNGQVGLSWQHPLSDGGSSLSGYRIMYRESGSPDFVFYGTTTATTSATTTGLMNGLSYDFQVSAINAVGTSVPATVSATLVPIYNLRVKFIDPDSHLGVTNLASSSLVLAGCGDTRIYSWAEIGSGVYDLALRSGQTCSYGVGESETKTTGLLSGDLRDLTGDPLEVKLGLKVVLRDHLGKIISPDNYIAFSSMRRTTLALKSDGTVWAWGDNEYGQLGDGTYSNSTVPVQVKDELGSGFLTDVIAIAEGSEFSLALKSDGTVWAWGDNWDGRLGNGTFDVSPLPVQVKDSTGTGYLSGIVAIATLNSTGLALKSDGTVWAWGNNENGQLGNAGQLFDGGDYNRDLPVQVVDVADGSGFMQGVAKIFGGNSSTAFVQKQDGTVWAWGNNGQGQIGDGSIDNRNQPVIVRNSAVPGDNLAGVKAIQSDNNFTLVVKSDGTVWAWGDNSRGQLGNGTLDPSLYPQQVKGFGGAGYLSGVKDIAVKSGTSLGLKSDGTVWSWGSNGVGELGNGSSGMAIDDASADSLYPVKVKELDDPTGYLTDVRAIIGHGYDYFMAQKTDGSFYSWGGNQTGMKNQLASTTSNTAVIASRCPIDTITYRGVSPSKIVGNAYYWALAPGAIGSLSIQENGYAAAELTNTGFASITTGSSSQLVLNLGRFERSTSPLSASGNYRGLVPEGTVRLAVPTASPASGVFNSAQQVILSASDADAKIYYTLDGSAPTVSSTPYTGQIAVTANAIVKAIAAKDGAEDSDPMSESYTITFPSSGGGGFSYFNYCDAVEYSGWNNACMGGFQLRSIVKRSPADCLLRTEQQLATLKRCEIRPGAITGSSATTTISLPAKKDAKKITIKKKPFVFNKTLRLGMKNNDVLELQKVLAKSGLLKAEYNGYFGQKTRQALLAYQRQKKLKRTGIADKDTRTVLNKR
jgi:alpha-tubulin suppressor-like RCC1 family protein